MSFTLEDIHGHFHGVQKPSQIILHGRRHNGCKQHHHAEKHNGIRKQHHHLHQRQEDCERHHQQNKPHKRRYEELQPDEDEQQARRPRHTAHHPQQLAEPSYNPWQHTESITANSSSSSSSVKHVCGCDDVNSTARSNVAAVRSIMGSSSPVAGVHVQPVDADAVVNIAALEAEIDEYWEQNADCSPPVVTGVVPTFQNRAAAVVVNSNTSTRSIAVVTPHSVGISCAIPTSWLGRYTPVEVLGHAQQLFNKASHVICISAHSQEDVVAMQAACMVIVQKFMMCWLEFEHPANLYEKYVKAAGVHPEDVCELIDVELEVLQAVNWQLL